MTRQESTDIRSFVRQEARGGRPRRASASEREIARRRLDDKRVEEKLTEIYDDGDGRSRRMRIYPPPRRRFLRALAVFVLSCVFFVAVAWTGFFALSPKGAFSEENVTFEIDGPERARAGDRATYRFRYANHDRVALGSVLLEVRYPEGFQPEEFSPSPRAGSDDSWEIGDLPPSGRGEVAVSGRILGDMGSAQSFRAFFNYTPANFSAEFQAVAIRRVELAETPVTLSLDAPKELARGASAAIVIRLAGSSTTADMPILVSLTAPVGFTRISSKPADDVKNPLAWTLSGLSGEKMITLRGAFSPPSGVDSGEFSVAVRGWKDKKRVGDGVLLAAASSTIAFANADAELALAVNGAVGETSALPGETLSASLRVKNSSDNPMTNIKLRVVFEAPALGKSSLLKWPELDDGNNGVVVGEQVSEEARRGIITWTPKEIPALKSIAPGSDLTIDLHLPIKGANDADLSEFALARILVSAVAEYESVGEKKTVSAPPMTITVLSDTEFDVRDAVSAAGGKEKHTIGWVVKNTAHELGDLRAEAELYGDISWDEKSLSVPAGSVSFDPQTRRVVWTTDQMPTWVDVLALQFAVVLNVKNPTQTRLSGSVAFKAADRVAGADIRRVGEEIVLSQ